MYWDTLLNSKINYFSVPYVLGHLYFKAIYLTLNIGTASIFNFLKSVLIQLHSVDFGTL